MVFVKRKLDTIPQTLGEKLRALRRGQADVPLRQDREGIRRVERVRRGGKAATFPAHMAAIPPL